MPSLIHACILVKRVSPKNILMELKNFNTYFFMLIIFGVSTVVFFIFQPFFIAITLAAILAVVFQRPFNFFLRITNQHRRVSAFLTAVFGIVLFSGLFFGIIGLIANEISKIYQEISVQNGGQNQRYVAYVIENVNNSQLLGSLGVDNFINQESITKSISQIGQNALVIFQKTYQSIASFLFSTVVMFFTLYYFLVGGRDLVSRIMFLSPLRDAHEKLLVKQFISMSRATIKGNLVIGLIQGTIGATLFFAVGIKSAIIWGTVMMFFSLLPMFGTSIIWFPAGIIMLLTGNVWQGIVILSVGFTLISTVDNVLSPKLIGKDTQMHPLIVFFATLGGINMFGFLGFIIGPIILALFITLWDIYAIEFKRQLKKYNN